MGELRWVHATLSGEGRRERALPRVSHYLGSCLSGGGTMARAVPVCKGFSSRQVRKVGNGAGEADVMYDTIFMPN